LHIGGTLVIVAGVALCEQRDTPRAKPARQESAPQPAQSRPAQTEPRTGRPPERAVPRQNPITALDRWNRMSPEQREKSLAKLPPERQAQVRERLERFNRLPKDEQDRQRQHYERFSRLSPEKQEQLRHQVLAYKQLPPERRPAISREISQLRRMTPAELAARFESDEFNETYSPSERQMLRDLTEFYGPAAPKPPK